MSRDSVYKLVMVEGEEESILKTDVDVINIDMVTSCFYDKDDMMQSLSELYDKDIKCDDVRVISPGGKYLSVMYKSDRERFINNDRSVNSGFVINWYKGYLLKHPEAFKKESIRNVSLPCVKKFLDTGKMTLDELDMVINAYFFDKDKNGGKKANYAKVREAYFIVKPFLRGRTVTKSGRLK